MIKKKFLHKFCWSNDPHIYLNILQGNDKKKSTYNKSYITVFLDVSVYNFINIELLKRMCNKVVTKSSEFSFKVLLQTWNFAKATILINWKIIF